MQDEDGSEAGASSNPLDAYASNLNELARQGRIDPLVGREHEVERVAESWRGVARTTLCWSVRQASARRLSPKGWRSGSSIIRCPIC